MGAGTLSITVDGPSKVDLACNEVENGYEVSYTPMAPGKYYVTVKYNGKNVAGSPFACYVDGENLTGDDAQLGSGEDIILPDYFNFLYTFYEVPGVITILALS